MIERRIARPETNPETQPFWDAAEEGRFLVKHCEACGRSHWYPRALCPFCFSDRTRWLEGSGLGTVYAFSVMRRAEVPYAVAYVTLDEGPTMLTNLVDCDFAALSIGQRVRLVWKPCEGGGRIPMFSPTP